MNRSSEARIWNDARIRMAMPLRLPPSLAKRLAIIADCAGFLFVIPDARDGDLVTMLAVGEQRLAKAALVVGDDVGGSPEDVAGRAIVALQPDHLGAGEILLEAQDVVDLGAAPAIDRLVVIANAADVG